MKRGYGLRGCLISVLLALTINTGCSNGAPIGDGKAGTSPRLGEEKPAPEEGVILEYVEDDEVER